MKQFTAYLQSKDLSISTQGYYVYNVTRFLNWYQNDPMTCNKARVLEYLAYLQNTLDLESSIRKNHLIAIDHYYNSLGLKEVTSFIKMRGTKKKKLNYVFSKEELTQLNDDYHHSYIQNFQPKKNHSENHNRIFLLTRQRNYVILGFLVYQGLITTEIDSLSVTDINFVKATVKIKRKGNVRTLPLNGSQIGALINYIQNIRPQFLSGKEQTDKLFLPLSEQVYSGSKDNLLVAPALRYLSNDLQSLHPKYLKAAQLRASVITNWIKTDGLRKAQYLAGHKSIISTEEYIPNNMEELASDLTKFNPF